MADPENPRSDSDEAARRLMRPRSPVLDLEATDITAPRQPLEVETPGVDTPPASPLSEPDEVDAAPPSPDLAGDALAEGKAPAGAVSDEDTPVEPASALPEPPVPEPVLSDGEPRSSLGALVGAGVAGAVIAIAVFLLLVSAELIPLRGASNPALGSRIAGVETEVRALSEKLSAPAGPADGEPIRDLAQSVQALREQVDALAAQVGNSEGSAQASDLDQKIAELSARLDAQEQAGTTASSSGEQVSALSGRLDELAAGLSAARQPDPSLTRAIEQAGQASTEASQAAATAGQASADAAKAIAEAGRAALLASVASLESAIARGVPYSGALSHVRNHISPETVAMLEAGAERGLPTLEILGLRLRDALEAAPRPEPQAEGLVDRLVEGARGLVRVRPAAGSAREIQGEDAWAVRTRIASRLERRAYAEALLEWDGLDALAKTASQQAADDLRARLAIDKALDAARAGAISGAEAQP